MRIGALTILFGLMGLLVGGILIYQATTIDLEDEKVTVDCFDHYNNKIIGVQCENKEVTSQQHLFIIVGFVIFVTMFGVGLLFDQMLQDTGQI